MKIPARLARHALTLKQHSPDILFGAGVVGSVTSTVLACRATLKLEEVLVAMEKDADLARQIHDENPEGYPEKDMEHDLMHVQFKGVLTIAKLYVPAVVVGGASIAALTKSHSILNSRNAALTAAYAALEKGFNQYRSRVVDRYGESIDRELRFPTEKVKEVNPETGREHTVDVVTDLGDYSVYARFFDPTSSSWNREPEYNLIFLRNQQQWANDLLHARGHVFLNDVYDQLGIPRSRAGAVVGWVLGSDGDGFIDFGIFDGNSESTRAFINGREGSILLDFNVDGVVYDQIEEVAKEALSWQKG